MGMLQPHLEPHVNQELHRRQFLAMTNTDQYVLLPKLAGAVWGRIVWEVGVPGVIEKDGLKDRNLLVMVNVGVVAFTNEYKDAGQHFVDGLNAGIAWRMVHDNKQSKKWWQLWK